MVSDYFYIINYMFLKNIYYILKIIQEQLLYSMNTRWYFIFVKCIKVTTHNIKSRKRMEKHTHRIAYLQEHPKYNSTAYRLKSNICACQEK